MPLYEPDWRAVRWAMSGVWKPEVEEEDVGAGDFSLYRLDTKTLTAAVTSANRL